MLYSSHIEDIKIVTLTNIQTKEALMKSTISRKLRHPVVLLAILILIGGTALPGFGSTGNLQAYPDAALEMMVFAPFALTHQVPQPDPGAIQIEVGTHDGVTLTPTVQVAAADVGTSGQLLMYIYLPVFNFGITIPPKTVTLESNQLVDLISNTLDFSNYPGLNFIVYCGYIKASGTIMYNAYTVTVVDYTTVPECAGLDQASCGSTNGCVWNIFPSSCSINCAQFDENSCAAAFDGNACQWSVTAFGSFCTTK